MSGNGSGDIFIAFSTANPGAFTASGVATASRCCRTKHLAAVRRHGAGDRGSGRQRPRGVRHHDRREQPPCHRAAARPAARGASQVQSARQPGIVKRERTMAEHDPLDGTHRRCRPQDRRRRRLRHRAHRRRACAPHDLLPRLHVGNPPEEGRHLGAVHARARRVPGARPPRGALPRRLPAATTWRRRWSISRPGHTGSVVGDVEAVLIEVDFEGATAAHFGLPPIHTHD